MVWRVCIILTKTPKDRFAYFPTLSCAPENVLFFLDIASSMALINILPILDRFHQPNNNVTFVRYYLL